jgi:hypothetical protein
MTLDSGQRRGCPEGGKNRRLLKTLGTLDEKVDQGSDPAEKNEKEDPNDFIIPLERVVLRAIHQHPNPETDQREHERNQQAKDQDREGDKFHVSESCNPGTMI